MKYLKIQNKGLLDIRLVSLMGGTTKRDDDFKIGQFGTGLKYVLAYLVRNNIDFKIFVGEKEISMTTKTELIREQEFRIIYIEGERSSITDKMGFDWKAWMIIRELWCNALDEGEAQKEVTETVSGTEGATTFYIQFVTEIKQVHDKWGNYFIHGETPMYDCPDFSIYSGGKSLRIYKQGVLIKENDEKPALFRYDIKNASINELREYTGLLDWDITKCLTNADKKVAEYALSTMKEDHYEGSMDYSWMSTKYSDSWSEALGNAKIIHERLVNDIKARELPIDLSGVVIVPKNLFISLNAQFKGISAVRVADKVNEFFEIFLPELELKIKSALATLESCGYFINPELKFIYGIFGDKTIFAQIHLDKKEILMSEQLMNKSMFEIICTIVEEAEHFNTGFVDCSRQFQTHFINLFTKTLLEKNEIAI
ncbi:MAG TPA: hypothetical protein VJY62_02600 [Bacteroidia bacterium]|nr:hypothetical protein [Bacteroidia bacterium]